MYKAVKIQRGNGKRQLAMFSDPYCPYCRRLEQTLLQLDDMVQVVRGAHYVSFSGWEKIDAEEVRKGEPHGRPRVKFVNIEEMLEHSGARTSDVGSGDK